MNFSAYLPLILLLAGAGYLWLWFHDTQKAMAVTQALFRVLIAVGTVVVKVVMALSRGIARLFGRK